MDINSEKNDLVFRFLMKVSTKVKGVELEFIRDQLESVLYDYAVSKIQETELSCRNDGKTTIELLEFFRIGKLASGRKESTIEQYLIAAKQLCTYVNKELNMVTTEDIRHFLVEYPSHNPEHKEINGSTMDGKRRNLSSIFSYLFVNEKIKINPMAKIERIKYKQTVKTPLTDAQIEEIKIACEKHKRNRTRNYAMILFMLDTGVRVSELANIKLGDVDFDNLTLKVLGKENKERYVYFTERTKVRLREYMIERKDINIFDMGTANIAEVPLFVSSRDFGKPMTDRAIQHMLTSIRNRSGLKTLHPHLLRATGATMWHKNGMPIDMCAELLGHANLNSVMIYVKNSPDQIRSEYRKLGNIA